MSDRSGRIPPAFPAAEEARHALQEQFYRVDQFQSDIGGSVKMYADLLPDRAARTGVVPGWNELDRRANELIVAYLELLDRWDPLEDCPPNRLQQAAYEFRQLTPRLGRLADDMDDYLGRFEPELRRVGEAKQGVERRVAEAAARVDEAVAAWQQMTTGGFSFPAADEAIARARVASRKLVEIGPRLTPDKVEEPATLVERLAEEARRLATDLPRRATALKGRLPSLTTRIEALENRATSVPEAMGALRREFSLGNWKDIADREQDVEKLLSSARAEVREMGRLSSAGDHVGALTLLDKLEEQLATAGEVVDGPRRRLQRLREIKANPQALFERTRFRLRDARYLVMKGRSVAPPPWAGRIDALASELINLEKLLEGVHPDYWALQQRIDSLDERIRQLIADFRASG